MAFYRLFPAILVYALEVGQILWDTRYIHVIRHLFWTTNENWISQVNEHDQHSTRIAAYSIGKTNEAVHHEYQNV